MQIEIQRFDLHQILLRTRMPFRYGIATMTEVPQVYVRLWVTIDGREWTGLAADLLPPKWFTKVPDQPIEQEIQEMLEVIEQALETSAGLTGDNPFEIWRDLSAAQMDWARAAQRPPLLAGFGTSLVERALLEAVCRAAGKPFAQLVRDDLLGIDLGAIHPALRGRRPADFLPAKPLGRILVRHTVGLADPLTEAEIAPGERLTDGLPQSLAASIQIYGLRHFKIKVSGQVSADRERLRGVARLLEQHAPADFAFSLDGNEQFKTVEPFQAWWDELRSHPDLRRFFEQLLFVEQPLHRDLALRPEVGMALKKWSGRPPLIIDESDGALEDLSSALHLGYVGTSHKNCKGIFKGIAHRCLLLHLQRTHPRETFLMSGEDLCNSGPVALLQDLAVMAALDLRSVERNGHHYLAGLSQFPREVQAEMLAHHADLYRRSPEGWPTLRISAGEVEVASLNRAPFGVGFPLELSRFARVR